MVNSLAVPPSESGLSSSYLSEPLFHARGRSVSVSPVAKTFEIFGSFLITLKFNLELDQFFDNFFYFELSEEYFAQDVLGFCYGQFEFGDFFPEGSPF